MCRICVSLWLVGSATQYAQYAFTGVPSSPRLVSHVSLFSENDGGGFGCEGLSIAFSLSERVSHKEFQ